MRSTNLLPLHRKHRKHPYDDIIRKSKITIDLEIFQKAVPVVKYSTGRGTRRLWFELMRYQDEYYIWVLDALTGKSPEYVKKYFT